MKTYSDDDLVLFFYGQHEDAVAVRQALAPVRSCSRYEALESVPTAGLEDR